MMTAFGIAMVIALGFGCFSLGYFIGSMRQACDTLGVIPRDEAYYDGLQDHPGAETPETIAEIVDDLPHCVHLHMPTRKESA